MGSEDGAETCRIALVTGANKGIGREIIRQLAEQGFVVYLGARDDSRGRQAERELREQGGAVGDVRFVPLDVTDGAQVAAAAERIGRESGRLDVLVNNAGIAVEHDEDATDISAAYGGSPTDLSVERLRAAYEVNVFGAYAVTRACLPLLRKSADGSVLNVSSPLGSLTLMNDPASPISGRPLLAYNSSKAALNALTVMLAALLRDEGIRVNAVNPGLVGTDLNGLSPVDDGVRTVQQGARVPVRLALEWAGSETGRFLADDEHAVDGIVPW